VQLIRRAYFIPNEFFNDLARSCVAQCVNSSPSQASESDEDRASKDSFDLSFFGF
jgi:hypothetical protein